MFKYLKDIVELRTKVASVFPFLFVLVIYLYGYSAYEFSILVTILFFISMLCLDMATTVLNHLAGISNEANMSIHDQKLLVQMKELGLKKSFNRKLLLALIATGVLTGLLVAMLSSIFVVLIGAICVVVAIAYSYGPLPLKNTCLGEAASGLTMGFLIPLAFLFSQDSSLFILNVTPEVLTLNLAAIIEWTFILLVPTFVIANIMLANNICDVEKDRDNGRLTLPLVIGIRFSKLIWGLLYVASYIIMIGLIVTGIVPKLVIYGLITIPLVVINSSRFISRPIKSKTFKYSVFNLQLILLSVIIPTVIHFIIFNV